MSRYLIFNVLIVLNNVILITLLLTNFYMADFCRINFRQLNDNISLMHQRKKANFNVLIIRITVGTKNHGWKHGKILLGKIPRGKISVTWIPNIKFLSYKIERYFCTLRFFYFCKEKDKNRSIKPAFFYKNNTIFR